MKGLASIVAIAAVVATTVAAQAPAQGGGGRGGRQGGPPPTSCRRAIRSHGNVGVGRHRRLAVEEGDASERRLRQRAIESGGPPRRRHVGSHEGQRCWRAVPPVRGPVDHACADGACGSRGRRHDAEARDRRGYANASLRFGPRAVVIRRSDVAGQLAGVPGPSSSRLAVLVSAAPATGTRRAQGRDDARAAWIPATRTACRTARMRWSRSTSTATPTSGRSGSRDDRCRGFPRYLTQPFITSSSFKRKLTTRSSPRRRARPRRRVPQRRPRATLVDVCRTRVLLRLRRRIRDEEDSARCRGDRHRRGCCRGRAAARPCADASRGGTSARDAVEAAATALGGVEKLRRCGI
jgi:hypothetical protein